jgi:tetratricopeptide (TPR) repeat protein
VGARTVIVALLSAVALGCATTRQDVETPADSGRGPAETAEFYLGNFYRSQMAKDLYQALAPASRTALTYNDFLLERAREIGVHDLDKQVGVARVEAAVLNGFRVNERHEVFWAIQQVRYPYAGAEHNHYRLLRLSVVNDRNHWYVEPFVDEATSTIRLLPALKVGPLRTLYDERETIAQLITNEINALRAGEVRPTMDVATDTTRLDIPDLTDGVNEIEEIKEIPDIGSADPAQQLASLLEVGKLYFRAGELDAAENAFKAALQIDPLDAAAADYLGRIRQRRQLEQIKQETIDLIERMLEVETEPESE